MMEHLTIAHLGKRGDGVADTPGGSVYVPYALPGETVEVGTGPAIPTAGACCGSSLRATSA
jgi:23S rRNA (uracil1939-C5)-methyltransferase